jgi:hypothetical protein
MSRVDRRLAIEVLRSRCAAMTPAGKDQLPNLGESEQLFRAALLLGDDETATVASSHFRAASEHWMDGAIHNLPPTLVLRPWVPPTLQEILASILPYEACRQHPVFVRHGAY